MTAGADYLAKQLAAARTRLAELRDRDDGSVRMAERIRALEIDAGLARISQTMGASGL